METKVIVVGSVKGVQKRRARLRLTGLWLNSIGFEFGSLVTAEYSQGSITLKLQGSGVDTYSRVVKGVLKTKSGLFQIQQTYHNKKLSPHIDITGQQLENLGFCIGSFVGIQYEYGFIRLRLVDLDKLGF